MEPEFELDDATIHQKLQELQKLLGKKQQFEESVSSIRSLFLKYYPSASPSLKQSVIFDQVVESPCLISRILKAQQAELITEEDVAGVKDNLFAISKLLMIGSHAKDVKIPTSTSPIPAAIAPIIEVYKKEMCRINQSIQACLAWKKELHAKLNKLKESITQDVEDIFPTTPNHQ